jgi:hypothetical protein
MIVRLNANSGPYKLGESKGFNKNQVKEMVQAYRKKPEARDSLHYAHFNAYEVLALFMANGILSEAVTKAIEADKAAIEAFGLKIYMGTHCFPITPPYPGTNKPGDYLGKTTAILCNTNIKTVGDKKEFWDMLGDSKAVGMANRDEIGPDEGLDQSEIAPPYTITSPDPNGDQDVNNAP